MSKTRNLKNGITALFLAFASTASAQYVEDEMIPWYGDTSTYVVMREGKFGILKDGKEVIPVKYEIENFMYAVNWDGQCYYSPGTHFALGADGKWGVMDCYGKTIVPFEYDYVTIERNNESGQMEYAGVEKNGKCAIMNSEGKLITGYDFDAFYGYYNNPGMLYSGNKLAVKKGEKILFYDPSKKKLLTEAPKQEFTPEARIVGYKMKMGAITRKGQVLLPVEYDYVRSASSMMYVSPDQPLVVSNGNRQGAWWPGKGMIIPVEYDNVTLDYCEATPYFVVLREKKYALFSGEGKQLTEFEYDSFSLFAGTITATKTVEQEYTISPEGNATLKKDK